MRARALGALTTIIVVAVVATGTLGLVALVVARALLASTLLRVVEAAIRGIGRAGRVCWSWRVVA